MTLHDEIFEQPEAARRHLGSSREALAELAAAHRARPFRSVVIAARGTSDHAAIYGQYLLGVRNGLNVGLATPSVVSIYGADPDVRDSLVIGISQSGASPDIVGVVAAAARQGAPTLAITNDPSSPLAEVAAHVIDLAAGPERAIAATKTYTTSLLAIARLSLALSPDAAASAALDAVPDAMRAALGLEPRVREVVDGLGSLDRCVIVGRGFEYATAREWALKLKELAQVFADPYSSADFRHGPIALVQPGIPALVLAPAGATAEQMAELVGDLEARDVDTVVLADAGPAHGHGRWPIQLPTGIPEWLRPVVSIVPGQLFAYHTTIARGLDPEAPRSLTKVTRTL
ncbi:MAG TPA: SIS domain-containing protein [Candidatus Limnocylindrales bacterium]|nr:SIS domain-containing protein [Candidatus Limnocylindrales bacterium]